MPAHYARTSAQAPIQLVSLDTKSVSFAKTILWECKSVTCTTRMFEMWVILYCNIKCIRQNTKQMLPPGNERIFSLECTPRLLYQKNIPESHYNNTKHFRKNQINVGLSDPYSLINFVNHASQLDTYSAAYEECPCCQERSLHFPTLICGIPAPGVETSFADFEVINVLVVAQALHIDFLSAAFETAAALGKAVCGFPTKTNEFPSAEFEVADIPLDAAILSPAVPTLSSVFEG